MHEEGEDAYRVEEIPLVNLGHQRRHLVVPEYPLVFPTVTQAYFIRTGSKLNYKQFCEVIRFCESTDIGARG
ncbi:hypothetical protein EMCRGX_G028117 [Ephydatia muelleri]